MIAGTLKLSPAVMRRRGRTGDGEDEEMKKSKSERVRGRDDGTRREEDCEAEA